MGALFGPDESDVSGADGTFHPVPCVVHMARYWRAWEMRWPIRELLNRGEPWDFLLLGMYGGPVFLKSGDSALDGTAYCI